jgi:hypothetical protein
VANGGTAGGTVVGGGFAVFWGKCWAFAGHPDMAFDEAETLAITAAFGALGSFLRWWLRNRDCDPPRPGTV